MLHPTISNRTFVPPAISAGGNSSNGLYMGQRVFLDPTVNVDALSYQGGAATQRFGKLVARTLQRYGAIVVTNSSGNGFQMLNPLSYTSIGQANPWPSLVGPDSSGYYGYAVPRSGLAPAGDGALRRSRSAPAGGLAAPAAPPATTTPTHTPAIRPAKRKRAVGWAAILKRRVVRGKNQVAVVVTVRSKARPSSPSAPARSAPRRCTAARRASRPTRPRRSSSGSPPGPAPAPGWPS